LLVISFSSCGDLSHVPSGLGHAETHQSDRLLGLGDNVLQ
jgi:hypothetical protein